MAIKFEDRVQEVTLTSFGGTGDVELNGTPISPAGRRKFVDTVGDSNKCKFLIDDNAGNWELSEGTLTDGVPDTLTRDRVIASSNADAKVNFATGQKDVVLVATSEDFGQKVNRISTLTTSTTLNERHHGMTFLCDASASAFVVTPPLSATLGNGWFVRFKKIDPSANAVTITPTSTDTVDTVSTVAITVQFDTRGITADGGTAFFSDKPDVQVDLDVPSQAEAEAGTATIERVWTAQRVGQAIAALATLPRSYLAGLGLSHAVDADHDITVAVGEARDDADAADLVLSSAITKQLDAAWAVGTNQGGLDTGVVAADTWYHVWLIRRSDTGIVDVLFSTSATNPTMPTNYDQKRHIGAVLTNSLSNIISGTWVGDYFIWDDPPLDVNESIGNTAVSRALSVMPGFQVIAILNGLADAAAASHGYVSSLDANDEAPSTSAAPLGSYEGGSNAAGVLGGFQVMTDTSQQIRIRNLAARTTQLVTLGYIYDRGRNA